MIRENDVKFVSLRVTDMHGKEMHLTVPANLIDEDTFEFGQAFDGSSFAGWRGIESSDMVLMPDPATAHMDPFRAETTLVMACDVRDPSTGEATHVTRVRLHVAPKSSCRVRGLLIRPSLVPNPNSLSLMRSAGITPWVRASLK